MEYNSDEDIDWEEVFANHSVNYIYPDDYEFNDHHTITYPSHIDKKVYLSSIFAASLILNVAVIIIQLRKPLLHWKRDIFPIMLSHIAVVNLLASFILILTNIIHLVEYSWHGSNLGCKYFMFTAMMVMYMNMFSVLGLLMANVAKLFTKNSERNITIALLFILPKWALSCISSAPEFYFYEKVNLYVGDNYYLCAGSLVELIYKRLYHILNSLLLYVFPFVVAVVLSVVYCVFRKKVSRRQTQNQPACQRSVESLELNSVEDEDHHTDEHQLLTTEVLPEKTSPYLPILINCVFFLMCTPYHICVMVHFFSLHYYSENFLKVYMWSHYFALGNIALTPLLIILFD